MKNILITGARSGIGNSVIEKIKHKNYHIYLAVHTEKQLKSIKEKYKKNKNMTCFKLDLTNKDDIEKVKGLDIDILINNAATNMGGSIAELQMDKVRENFEVNVFGPFEIIQIILKDMINKNKQGKIINIASLAGIIPQNFIGVYSATKASIIKLTTTLKNELKLINKNIKIVLIEPGLYQTGFNEVMFENKYDWMKKDSLFKEELNIIRNKENYLLTHFQKRKLNSITNKIVKAIKCKNPKFIYRAPISQVIFAKLYQLFKE